MADVGRPSQQWQSHPRQVVQRCAGRQLSKPEEEANKECFFSSRLYLSGKHISLFLPKLVWVKVFITTETKLKFTKASLT